MNRHEPLPPETALTAPEPLDADPILLSSEGDPWRSEVLAHQAREGQLARLARGIYCALETWLRCAPWDRHLLAVVAHAKSRNREVVFSHRTAAALHGFPNGDVPVVIHTRATSRGGSGCSIAPGPADSASVTRYHSPMPGPSPRRNP